MSATADETLIEIPLKIPEEKKISWEKQQQVIDELRTIRINIYIYISKTEYEKIINLLHRATIQPSKFRIINWVEVINDAHGTYSTHSQIKSNLNDNANFKSVWLQWCVYTCDKNYDNY